MTSKQLFMDVSQDWVLACDVQERFMQRFDQPMDALDYAGRCRQVRALGGDCFDFAPLAAQRLTLTIGDASGKGLAGALMISNVQSSLRTAAWFSGNDLAFMLEVVNQQVYASSLADRYATLFYGVFDAPTRTLRYVNAGHNPPMVVRCDGSVIWLESGGIPVGMFADSTYDEGTVQLNPGDLVIACTDGVIEAVNAFGEEWGLEGVRKAAAKSGAQSAGDVVEAIFTSMDDFSGDCQSDDATVVALRAH